MSGPATIASGELLLGPHEARILRAHLDRLRRWNERSFVRIVSSAHHLGVYAAPPLGVMSHISLPLSRPGPPSMDATVPASEVSLGMGSRLDEAGVAVASTLTIPTGMTGVPELAVLPPIDGWQLPIPGVAGDVMPTVEAAVAEFKARRSSVPDADALAAEIWDRPAFGGLPMRALHAARLLGLLSADSSRIAACTRTGWKRLSTVRGQVYVRVPSALDRPSLAVVR